MVLMVIQLHIVSVVTNFVFQSVTKKQKTNKKHHTFSSTAGSRLSITILGMVIEEVRPIFCTPLTFFDLSSSFAARGY